MEALFAFIMKVGMVVMTAFIGHLYWDKRETKKKIDDRLDKLEDTRLTKDQTIEQIEFRIEPLRMKMDHYSEVVEENTRAVRELTMITSKNTEEFRAAVSDLKTTVALISQEVKHGRRKEDN